MINVRTEESSTYTISEVPPELFLYTHMIEMLSSNNRTPDFILYT